MAEVGIVHLTDTIQKMADLTCVCAGIVKGGFSFTAILQASKLFDDIKLLCADIPLDVKEIKGLDAIEMAQLGTAAAKAIEQIVAAVV